MRGRPRHDIIIALEVTRFTVLDVNMANVVLCVYSHQYVFVGLSAERVSIVHD